MGETFVEQDSRSAEAATASTWAGGMRQVNTFELAGRAFATAGLGRVAQRLHPDRRTRVVALHGVSPDDLDNFATVVRGLLRTYAPLSPATFFDHADKRQPILRPSFVLSFDDGLLSSYTAARRVLEPLGIRAMFFVPTQVLELEREEEMRSFHRRRLLFGRTGTTRTGPEHWITMNDGHLRELHAAGHSVFPHTYSHRSLRDIKTADDVLRELVQPKEHLENLLQAPAEAFAPPVGNETHSSRFGYNAIRSNYSYSFTSFYGGNSFSRDPCFFFRDSLLASQSLSFVRQIVGGAYDLYYDQRMWRFVRSVS